MLSRYRGSPRWGLQEGSRAFGLQLIQGLQSTRFCPSVHGRKGEHAGQLSQPVCEPIHLATQMGMCQALYQVR